MSALTARTSVPIAWRTAILASSLPSTARLVALVLSTHMNGAGGSCYPSLSTLQRETGLSRKTVWRALDAIEQAGFVERERRRGRANNYRALGAERTHQLGAQGTQLGAQGNELGASGHPEDVQEDVHKDVTPSTRADARGTGKRASGARRKKNSEAEWEGVEAYDRV